MLHVKLWPDAARIDYLREQQIFVLPNEEIRRQFSAKWKFFARRGGNTCNTIRPQHAMQHLSRYKLQENVARFTTALLLLRLATWKFVAHGDSQYVQHQVTTWHATCFARKVWENVFSSLTLALSDKATGQAYSIAGLNSSEKISFLACVLLLMVCNTF